MPGEYTQLDTDIWEELPNRHVYKSGNLYAGKEYSEGYDVRVFVRKLDRSEICKK